MTSPSKHAPPGLPGAGGQAAAGVPLPHLQLRLLGDFELHDLRTGAAIRLPTRATMLLLARLALEPRRSHGREELVDLLWPEAAPEVGRNRLRQALSVLRKLLGAGATDAPPALVGDRRAVGLAAGALHCDAHALRQALQRGDQAAARELYRGELLPGFYDEWVLQARGDLAAQMEAALRVSLGAAAAAAASLPRLPSYPTTLHGFDEARSQLEAAVLAHRLVVLRGPGGGGKTRLAVEAAHALQSARTAPRGFDHVVFVALAACHARATMIDAVLLALQHGAAAATMPVAADAAARVEQALLGRHVLLVLDNFEQLVDSAAADLARWLSRLPNLHLLVTSRCVLGLPGEVECVVPPLALPGPRASLAAAARSPAVAMFVERARASRPGFELREDHRADLVALVRRLQGLPLAIELAAARVTSVPLAAMLHALAEPAGTAAGGTLALLAHAGPRATDDPRHASMLDVVAWSWRLLDDDARAALSALAVFGAGATLDTLSAVLGLDAAQTAARVDGLVAASVAYVSEGARGQSRSHPYEPMREYALAQLDAAALAALRARMCSALAHWAHALGPEPDLDVFRDEVPNLAAAWADVQSQADAAATLRMALDCAAALVDVTLPPAALDALGRAAALHGDDDGADPPAASVHALLAQQRFECGEPAVAQDHARRALQGAARCTGLERAEVLRAAARVLLRTSGPGAEVEPLLDEALALARREHSHDLQARVLSLLAVLRSQRDRDHAASLALRREALALWQRHGPAGRLSEGLVNLALGLGASRAGLAEKLELLDEARDVASERGQLRLLAFVHSVRAYVLADLGRWGDAAAGHLACLRLAWDGGMWREWFYGLWNLPRTLAHRRRPEAAVRLMGFAEAFGERHFGALGPSDRVEARRARRLACVQLGAGRAQAMWQGGRLLTMEAAMRLAEREAEALLAHPPNAVGKAAE